MERDKIAQVLKELRARGLSNGGSLGYHAGWCDEVADLIEDLTEENRRLHAICKDFLRNSQTEQVNLLLYIRSKAEIFYNSVGVSFLAVDVADIDRIVKKISEET